MKLRTLAMEHMRWPEIREALDNGYDTAIVFAASIEQHGPHLPIDTDEVLGYAGALDLAERLGNALVAPIIRPGLSKHHMPLPGSLTLRPEIFEGIVEDYVAAYVHHGFKKIVLTSSHGGNFATMEKVAAKTNALYKDKGVAVVSGMTLATMLDVLAEQESVLGVEPGTFGGHADAWEASEMLMLGCEDVDLSAAQQGYMGGLLGEKVNKVLSEDGGFVKLSPCGIIGDPTVSTVEIGEHLFKLLQDEQEKAIRANFAKEGAAL